MWWTLAASVRRIPGVLLALLACGCTPEATDLGYGRQSVLYGPDDRVEVVEYSDPAMRDVATRRVGTFFFQSQVTLQSPGGNAQLKTQTLHERLGICAEERFSDQPSAAHCSGVVLSDDLVLTAGHCLGRNITAAQTSCRELVFVFGYLLDQQGHRMPIARNQVFACRSVLIHVYDMGQASSGDFAVLQVDRPFGSEHLPVTLATQVEVGTPLTTVGNGAGLPTKIAANAVVTEVLEALPYLRAATDSFSGGSGSAIFDENLELVAIQSRGQPDWSWDDTNGCFVAATATDGFESHQLARFATDRLCELVPCASKSLCSRNDTAAWEQRCDAISAPPTCGDQVCSPDERDDCAEDCSWVERVPWGWSCHSGNYGTGDGCHCSCGAVDSDCMNETQSIRDCGGAPTCGSCVDLVRQSSKSSGTCGVAWSTRPGMAPVWFTTLVAYLLVGLLPRRSYPNNRRRKFKHV
jgi:V8-like Glu-specific endopeptidase